MFYSVVIPRYQPGVGLSPGGAEPADHGWDSLQSRSDTIITCLGAGTQLWGCHRSNSSWQRTVLFAWLFSPASFRFQRLGIQSSGIPEIKVLLLPRRRLARNCSRQQCQAGWIWNQNLPFLSSAQRSWKCQGFAQNSNKTTAGRVGVLQKRKYSPGERSGFICQALCKPVLDDIWALAVVWSVLWNRKGNRKQQQWNCTASFSQRFSACVHSTLNWCLKWGLA